MAPLHIPKIILTAKLCLPIIGWWLVKFKLNQPVQITISHQVRTPIEVDLVLIDERNEANRSWYYQNFWSRSDRNGFYGSLRFIFTIKSQHIEWGKRFHRSPGVLLSSSPVLSILSERKRGERWQPSLSFEEGNLGERGGKMASPEI